MEKRLGVIIVTHGEIGRSLLDVARYILGRKLENFIAVKVPFMSELREGLGTDVAAPFAVREELIRQEINRARLVVDQGNGVMILADILGGTGFNVARDLLGGDPGAIVSGVNLPMILKAAELKTFDPQACAAELADRSRKAIICGVPRNR